VGAARTGSTCSDAWSAYRSRNCRRRNSRASEIAFKPVTRSGHNAAQSFAAEVSFSNRSGFCARRRPTCRATGLSLPINSSRSPFGGTRLSLAAHVRSTARAGMFDWTGPPAGYIHRNLRDRGISDMTSIDERATTAAKVVELPIAHPLPGPAPTITQLSTPTLGGAIGSDFRSGLNLLSSAAARRC
jgi:hypothetical protein